MKTINYYSKYYGQCKQFFADKQTDKRTGPKQYAPDLLMRGHKNFIENGW